VTRALQYLYYNTYCSGRAGLSNGIMSVEIGVILSALMNRLLVLDGNVSPTANVVEYGDLASDARSRITDLFDLPVPWTEADACGLRDLRAVELSPTSLWNAVFYYPPGLDTTSEDFRAFARGRDCWLTYGDDLAASPVVSLSGGPDKLYNLSFYCYFFYLDAPTRRRVDDILRAMTPKRPLAQFAGRVARTLGAFNAVHVRRGDFKRTYGVTTRDRRPEHALDVLDQNFSRDDVLLILTDERDDPFFDEIRRAYPRSVFADDLIRRDHGADFAQMPCRDSIAIAFLSQLIAAEAKDFVGTMTSTFTALIQRYRGNRGVGRDFKFLWNELPDEGSPLERGSHALSDCVPMARGVMLEQFDGPYSWNRFNHRINPAWMREWPEAFLSPRALNEIGENAAAAVAGGAAPAGPGERDTLFIRFGDDQVEVVASTLEVRETIEARFRPMIAVRGGRLVGTVSAHREGDRGWVRDADGMCPAATLSDMMSVLNRAVVRAFMRARSDLVWLHAAAVDHAGRALVLAAPWGRGKSALSTSLLGLGWKYLSDDIVPFDPATLAVHPFPKTLRIREHAGRALDTEDVAKLAKRDVPLRGDDIAVQPTACGGVVFPRFGWDAPNRLSPCRAPFAVLELLPGCLSFAQHPEAALRFAGMLVQAVPAFHLSFHDSRMAAKLLTERFAVSPAGRSSRSAPKDQR